MPLEELQLGQYHLMRLIGSGSIGEVYLGTNTRTNRQVAIKVLRAEATSSDNAEATQEVVGLFESEMQAIMALDHPQILPLFDFGEESTNQAMFLYMVMPFRREGSLADWVQSQAGQAPYTPPPREVAYFVQQAANALQYAHDRGILHQNVKPSNFLIRTNQEQPNQPDLLLTDFGIASLSKLIAETSSLSVAGTPTYMAPEQWNGHVVPETDQYALAIMAYQLLTGRPPFSGDPEQLKYLHLNVQPLPPTAINPHLPRDIDTVILQGLAKQSKDRFAAISAFARAFQLSVPRITVDLANVTNTGTLRATLFLTKAEALTGTHRTLTLPGKRKVTIVVPAGAYHGQEILLANQGTDSDVSEGSVLVTISIRQTEEIPATPPVTPRTPPTSPTATSMGSTQLAPFPSQSEPPPETPFSPASMGSTNLSPFPPRSQPEPGIPFPSEPQPPPSPSQAQRPIEDISTFRFAGGNRSNRVNTLVQRYQGLPTDRKILAILLIGLLILIIAVTTGLLYVTTSNSPNTSDATATAQATARATAARATRTVQTNGGYPFSNTLLLNDPLTNNSKGQQWEEGSDEIGSCAFTGGAYHDSLEQANRFHACIARASNFSNFTYEVQMTIIKGDCGGIIFRRSGPSFYYLRVCQDGSYTFIRYASDTDTQKNLTLKTSTAAAIHKGLNQANLVAVVARGSKLDLYVNRQLIASVSDNSYTQGQIGLVAKEIQNPTEVVFSNVKVWKL